MNDKKYNGWTNYETWAVALWIDNDEGLYGIRVQLIEEAEKNLDNKYQIADRLKEWVHDMAPNCEASLWSDLLNAALSEVNWVEIAENWMEEIWAR